jgi:hypothetical protein
MVKKNYITRKQTAVFTCPMCQISKTTDVSKFIKLDKMAKFKVRCRCGHTFTSFLERRKHYRKETNLTGSFVRLVSGKPLGRGHMTVRDLSLTGMKLEVHCPHNFSEGDILVIQFRLDDVKKTLTKMKANKNRYNN